MVLTFSPMGYAALVLRRIADVFIVMPALLFFTLGLALHQFSFNTVAAHWYDILEQTVSASRDAPPGYLAVLQCKNPTASKQIVSPCDPVEATLVRTDVLAADTASTLTSVYWLIVLLNAGVQMLVLGPRQFFHMKNHETTPFPKRTP